MSSWIDHALQSAQIRQVFIGVLDAAPETPSRARVQPALTPDAGPTTYWERPRSMGRVPVDRLPACDSPETLADGLAVFWRDQGQPELAALAPAFAALATHLKGALDPSAEPPELIYTLF